MARYIDGDADESVTTPAKRAEMDSRSASLKLLATAAGCYPGSDDRLITDYHVTMIGYGKKRVSHP